MKLFLLIPFLLSLVVTAGAADAPDPALVKLRESLKAALLQVRSLEGEKAALQATQAELEAKNKELTDQVAKMGKQLAADKTEAEKSIASLTDKADGLKKEGVLLRESLEKWKAGYNKAASIAKAKESERVKFSDKAIELERKVLDRETKNLALYKLGQEILQRYENYGLGRALLAREPFTGIAKIKLQELVADYADKLQDQKIKPSLEDSSGKPKPAPSAQPTTAPANAPASAPASAPATTSGKKS